MKLNHLSLAVPDVDITSAFFKKYFQFEEIETKGNNVIVVLRGKGNFTLVLTTAKKNENNYPTDFHFGFLLNNREEVVTIFEQLKEGDYTTEDGPSKIRNTFGFYLTIPGNVLMEVSCAMDA